MVGVGSSSLLGRTISLSPITLPRLPSRISYRDKNHPFPLKTDTRLPALGHSDSLVMLLRSHAMRHPARKRRPEMPGHLTPLIEANRDGI